VVAVDEKEQRLPLALAQTVRERPPEVVAALVDEKPFSTMPLRRLNCTTRAPAL
jgi:hypothetical protein